MSDADRVLSDDDVKAIVLELKRQLTTDLQIEVGKGVLTWLKRAFWALVILIALYGFAHDKDAQRVVTNKLSAMDARGWPAALTQVFPLRADAPFDLRRAAARLDHKIAQRRRAQSNERS